MRALSTFVSALLIAAGIAASANAGTVSYTDRAAFEAALSGVSVDNLDGATHGFFGGNLVRPGYTITTAQMYGCANAGDCGDNSSRGINFTGNGTAYLWNYIGADTVTFNSAVNGFGFNFAAPTCCSGASSPIINGVAGSADWGFFGIISDVALTSFTLDQTSSFLVMDDLTFGLAGPTDVPEPALPALVGISLLGLAVARRRKQK